jgi:crotonobetainyl-CoA:carnitine CoA-transferase CaiB-like acyl-CoA transferase
VLMALLARDRTGAGETIDLSMFDCLLPWCAHIAGPAVVAGAAVISATARSLGGAAFYNVYATADGRHVVLCGREEKFARALLGALGRLDLLPLALAEPGPAQQPLRAFLAGTFASRSRDAWVEWMAAHDVAFAPVLDFAEALASSLVCERGLLVESAGRHLLAPAIRFGSQPPWQPGAVPAREMP